MTKLSKIFSLLVLGWFLGIVHVTFAETQRKGFMTFLVHGKEEV